MLYGIEFSELLINFSESRFPEDRLTGHRKINCQAGFPEVRSRTSDVVFRNRKRLAGDRLSFTNLNRFQLTACKPI